MSLATTIMRLVAAGAVALGLGGCMRKIEPPDVSPEALRQREFGVAIAGLDTGARTIFGGTNCELPYVK